MGSLVGLGRRGVASAIAGALLLAGVVAVEPWSASVARAQLPGYDGVDPALTESLRADALAAADSLLVEGEPGGEEGVAPDPVDDGQDVAVGHVPPSEVLAEYADAPPVDPPTAPESTPDVPVGFVEGESEVVSGSSTSLTYQNPDGSFTKEIFPGPSVFRDETGEWTQFDPQPVVDGDRLEVPDAKVETSFAAEGDAERLVEVRSGWRSAGFSLEGAADVQAVPTETGVRYSEILPGVDLVEHAVFQGVKEELVLAAQPASAPVFRFRLSSTGLFPQEGEAGSIELVDSAGRVVFVIPEGTAWDSNTEQPEELNRVPVVTRLVNDNGAWVVELVPDWAWMSDPARVYPVVVDPQVVSSSWSTTKSDAWVWYQNPNVRYDDITGSYSQWSSTWNAYVNRIGYTRVSGVWHQYRTYMKFVLGLPAAARVITSATLEADVIWVRDYSTAGVVTAPTGYASQIGMWRVTSPWSVGQPATPGLTWNLQPSNDFWGGQVVNASQSGNLSANVTSWVQGWFANPSSNNGVMFGGLGYSLPGDGHGFTVLKALESDVPPVLRVTYVSAPVLISPAAVVADMHLLPEDGVSFSWSEPDNQTSGRVKVCTNDLFTENCVYSGFGLGTASIAAKHLPHGVSLYWRVEKPYAGDYLVSSHRTFKMKNTAPNPIASTTEIGEGGFFETTTPTITVPAASDPEGDPVEYRFKVCTQPNEGGHCQESGPLSSPSWTAGSVPWAETYFWKITVWDGLLNGMVYTEGLESTSPNSSIGATQWTLGTFPAGAPSGNVELASGNLTFSAVDVDPVSVGVDIGASRTYNSRDDRVSGLFGQGWTHPADMWVEIDGTDNALVHLADGRTQFHGKSSTGFDDAWGAAGKLDPAAGGGYTFTLPSGVIYHFVDRNGSSGSAELASIFDPSVTIAPGVTTTFTWTASTLTVRDEASGRSLIYTLQPGSGSSMHAVSVVPSGAPDEVWTYLYNSDRLMKACSPDVDPTASVHTMCTEYRYGPDNLGPKITSVWSPQTTTGTAAQPNVSPTNKKELFTVTYDSFGQVVSQTNGAGSTWAYGYLAIDEPVAPPVGTLPTGIAKYKVTATTPRGGATTYYFDATRRLLFQQGATGAQQWWQYDERGFLTKTTSRIAPGATTTSFATTLYVNDAAGQMVSRTDPNGAVWQWTYNAKGRVTKEIDPYGFTTDTAYFSTEPVDPSDDTHVESVTRRAAPTGSTQLLPVGHGDAATAYTYTVASTLAYGAGQGVHPPLWLLATVTDELGQVTEFRYDQGGDLRWSRTGNATRGYMFTRFTYDSVGRKLLTETSTDDATWTVTEDNEYDAAGRVIRTDGPLTVNAVTGQPHRVRVSTVYDDAGNPLSVTKSDVGGGSSPDAARTTTYHYDDAQRLDRVTDALGNATDREYDADGNLAATIDARGTRVEYTYDLSGRELTTTVKNLVDDPIGAPAVTRDVLLSSKTYDVAGRLATETDALGRVTATTYDPAGMGWPVKVVLTSGSYTNILAATTYDLAGRMVEAWRYGTPGAPGQNDSFLQYSTTAYDLWGRSASVTTYDTASNGAGGGTVNRVETTTYDKSGGVLTTTTTGGSTTSQTRQTYLENGWLATSTAENGAVDLTTTYGYDTYGRMVSITDPSGNVTTHTYDVAGRSVSTTLPAVDVVTVDRDAGTASTASAAATTTLGYNTFGEVTHTQTATGLVTVSSYDVLGRRTQITHPSYTAPGGGAVVPTETFAYDANGNLASTTDRIGSTTTFTYDRMNRVVRRVDPAAGSAPAGVTRYTYDDGGNVLSTVDPIGAVVESTYDAMGMAISSTQKVRRSGGVVDSFTSTVERDRAGRPVETCSPQVNGETPCATAVYSPFGQLLRQIDPLGEATVYDYDGLGRSKSVTDPAGHRATTSYDLAGRVASVSNYGTNGALVDTTVYTRNQAGLVTHVDLPGGGQFNYAYDNRYRMTSVQQLKTATPAPEWITVSYGYDNLDRLVSTVDGRGNQWLTTYNSLGLEQDQIEPSTPGQTAISDRRYTSHYNAGGLLLRLDEPGGVQVQYSYDELARLTMESAAITASTPAAVASFGYDAAGRMTSFSAPGGDVALTYDDRGLLLSVSGPNTPSSFEYDALGRMTKRTDATGESLYQWDTDGRLVADTDPLTNTTRTYGWNDWDRVESVSYSAGGMQRAYTYDTAGRLATDTLTGDGVEQRRTVYAYDGAGRLVTETISGQASVVGQGVNSYGYDAAGRLVSWTNPAAQVTGYSWDDAGNRTGEGSVTSLYDARNRITGSSNGDTFTWSARGTLVSQSVSGGSSNFTFDGLGRMVTVDGLGYQYDALGRIAARSDGAAGWVGFAYSGTGLQPVSDGNGLIARSPGGAPVATKVGSAAAVSVGLDRHGDVVSTFDPVAGTVEGSVEYDPFGEVTGSGGASAGNIGFQGAYTDPVSKLVDMGARWYSPGMGRFVSRDTIRPLLGTPVSLNMYTYANNDPLGHFDPDGHCAARIDNMYCAGSFKSKGAVAPKGPPVRHVGYCDRGCERPAARVDCDRGCDHPSPPPPPDPIVACVNDSKCSPKRMVELINASKDDGLGSLIFAAIEGADVDGELDGNWGQKSIDAASRGGADLVMAIRSAFDNKIDGANARALAGLAQKVAQKIQRHKSDFEKIDHERSFLEKHAGFIAVGLAVLSFVPVVGDVIDGAQCLMGDPIACASVMVPGSLSAANKVRKAVRGVENAVDVVHGLDNLGDVSRSLENLSDAGRASKARKMAGKVCHSFAALTLVLMADGSAKRIDQVEVGDRVAATEITSGRVVSAEVSVLHRNFDSDLVDVEVEGADGVRSVVHTTSRHLWWSVGRGGWVEAADLVAGDRLWSADGERVVVVDTRWVGGSDWMYDLTVDDVHTFHVLAGDTPVLVHNSNGCDDLSPGATKAGGGLVEGPNGAMRDPATGRFAANPNRVAPEPGSSVHGNARLSQQETSLYQMYDLEGNYLKTGITSNPGGRYSQDFMSDKYMDVINVGSRSNMLDLERMIVEIDPGPLNFEPWAGVGR